MKRTGPVHFIHLGGEWRWQHWRAVETARRMQAPLTVEGATTIIWNATTHTDFGFYPHHVEVRPLELPEWLRDHPIQLANVKDLFAWTLLHEHGGLYLDLDTISLRPVWDWLPGDADVVVSRESPPVENWEHPYNSAVVVGRKGAPVLLRLAEEAHAILKRGEARWGKTGPHLLTGFVKEWSGAIVAAPFPVLSGWSYHGIGDYYANPRDPGFPVCVIHLYSSDHPEWLEDKWYPNKEKRHDRGHG